MPELWQFDLLSAKALGNLHTGRGMGPLHHEAIEKLWQIGLIRADLLRSTAPLSIDRLDLVGQDGQTHFYFDSRPIPLRAAGYGSAFQPLSTLDGITLLFHPFRLYVLYHIIRVFDVPASSIQYLFYPDGYRTIVDFHVQHLDRWTSTGEFSDRFEDWNRTAELAIVAEPLFYERIFQSLRMRNGDTEASHRNKIEQFRPVLRKIFSGVTPLKLDEVRRAVARQSG